jgi:outer membrane protein assembly factor BamB
VWKTQVSDGGIIGGEWGSLSYAAGGGSPPIIMMGRLYHNLPGGKFRCQDLRTGEILWDADGSISIGHHLEGPPSVRATFYIQTFLGTMRPYLIGLGRSAWTVYDPYTGRLLRTIENVPETWPDESGYGGRAITSKWRDGSPIVYCLRFAGYNITTKHYDVYEAYKWDYTKVTGNDWLTGVVWKADLKRPDTRVPGESRGHVFGGLQVDEPDGVAAFYTFNENIIAAIDLNTGAYVWNISLPYINTAYGQMGLDGNILTFDHKASQVLAYDVKTGAELWRSEAMEYPWGTNARITGPTAYGATYVYAYDGHIYAFDVNTGATKWVSDISGFTSELPYNTWAFYNNPKIADGKIFATTSEHTPTQPLPRGNRLFCMDANTGKAVWNVSGAIRPTAIAEGYLVGRSEYDGYMYVFGKGKSETSVMVGPKVIPKGSGVVIEGTVLDMSPAQAGTPAIADKDMSAWMNYKHMQRLEPGTTPNYDTWGTDVDVTGVPVELRVVHPNGNEEWISTVTSDGQGVFGHEWTPPSEGLYRIIANFTGSSSYWPSKAETVLSVGPAPEPSVPVEPEPVPPPAEAPFITTEVAIIIAVAVVAVIGVAAFWILRKRE